MRVLGFPAATADWLAKRLDGHAGAATAAEWLEMAEGKALWQQSGCYRFSTRVKQVCRRSNGSSMRSHAQSQISNCVAF